MTRWFSDTFLPSIFQRAELNKGVWLSQKQTKICVDNMERHNVHYLDEYGVGCNRLYYDCKWQGRDVYLQYSKLNGCGMIFFGMNATEIEEQERKNQEERDDNEIKRLQRRYERHKDKFISDMRDLQKNIAEVKEELEEEQAERYVKSLTEYIASSEKKLAWMKEIRRAGEPA